MELGEGGPVQVLTALSVRYPSFRGFVARSTRPFTVRQQPIRSPKADYDKKQVNITSLVPRCILPPVDCIIMHFQRSLIAHLYTKLSYFTVPLLFGLLQSMQEVCKTRMTNGMESSIVCWTAIIHRTRIKWKNENPQLREQLCSKLQSCVVHELNGTDSSS